MAATKIDEIIANDFILARLESSSLGIESKLDDNIDIITSSSKPYNLIKLALWDSQLIAVLIQLSNRYIRSSISYQQPRYAF